MENRMSVIIPSWQQVNLDLQAETGSIYPSLILFEQRGDFRHQEHP